MSANPCRRWASILQKDGPRRMLLHFLRPVSREQMVDAYIEAFVNNAPDAQKTLKAEIDGLLAAFDSVGKGDEMTFTYIPGIGTTLAIRNEDKVTIPGQPFARAMFAAWLGPKPPSSGLKKGLLGQ